MEQKEKQKWHLVRNNNGEWICSDQVVYLDDFSTMIYHLRAKKHGLPLSPQTDYEGETWYYRHEVEAIEAVMKAEQQEMKPRKLKTTPVKREISEKEINDITMNMLKPNANGCFDALDEECRLWQELENNPPQCWKNILEDKALYVEIRKDNYVNVYYYGGNVALLRWTGGKITAETHRKYLGKPDETDLYQDCTEILHSKEGLDLIKENIREEYHKLSKREKTDEPNRVYTSNEKWVQGELKLRFPKRYIDSEFAYRIGKNNLIRFDLVELKRNELRFIEIKLITDSRLRSNDKKPEIINQMTKYSHFIREHTEVLKDYYTKLLRIKKRIGLWNGETEIEHIALKPILLIVNTYKGILSKGRENRKNSIEELKENTMFETIIVSYPDLCR